MPSAATVEAEDKLIEVGLKVLAAPASTSTPFALGLVVPENPAGSFGPARRSARPANPAGSAVSRPVRLPARPGAARGGSRNGSQNAGDRALPAGVALLPLACGHLWRKAAFGAPCANQRLRLGIEAAREARDISGPPCGGLDRIRPLDDRRQNVGDELHCPIACGHAAIDAQAGYGDPGIGRHRFNEIARLIADGFERGARDLRETA